MRNLIYSICFFATIIIACKKEIQPLSYASVNIVNAVAGSGTVKVNYHGRSIRWSSLTGNTGNIAFASSQILTIFNNNNDYPLTIVPSLDTLKSIFSERLKIEPTGIYTLFIMGKSDAYEALFVKEQSISYNLRDSTIAIRFINVSTSGQKINISRTISPTIKETEGLGYKQLTEFRQYQLKKIVPMGSVTFEVRDASNNTLLTTYAIPNSPNTSYPTVSASLSRFKSLTLVINSFIDNKTGTNIYSVFPVPHYN